MKSPGTVISREGMRAVMLFMIVILVWFFSSEAGYFNRTVRTIAFVTITALLIYFLVYDFSRRLRRMTTEYRGLFINHPSPMWIFDPATLQFLAVNKAATKHYGYSRSEFLSMTILEIRPDASVAAVQDTLTDSAPRELKESVWEHQKKNGDVINVRIITSDVSFNKKPARLVEVQDITAHLAQQREIEKLSMVARSASNGVIISDSTGKIEWVNDAFTKVTGYSLAEVKGKHPRSFLHGDDTDKETETRIIELAQNKEGFSGEIINYKKDGTPYWVHLNLSPVLEEGEVKNIIVIQTDVTQIRQQYEQLRQIAFMTSHEARSQLTNIMSLCELIRDAATGTEQQELAMYLNTAARKLDQVIHTIVKSTSASSNQ
jgi:PAS domain S-box-containing protein